MSFQLCTPSQHGCHPIPRSFKIIPRVVPCTQEKKKRRQDHARWCFDLVRIKHTLIILLPLRRTPSASVQDLRKWPGHGPRIANPFHETVPTRFITRVLEFPMNDTKTRPLTWRGGKHIVRRGLIHSPQKNVPNASAKRTTVCLVCAWYPLNDTRQPTFEPREQVLSTVVDVLPLHRNQYSFLLFSFLRMRDLRIMSIPFNLSTSQEPRPISRTIRIVFPQQKEQRRELRTNVSGWDF